MAEFAFDPEIAGVLPHHLAQVGVFGKHFQVLRLIRSPASRRRGPRCRVALCNRRNDQDKNRADRDRRPTKKSIHLFRRLEVGSYSSMSTDTPPGCQALREVVLPCDHFYCLCFRSAAKNPRRRSSRQLQAFGPGLVRSGPYRLLCVLQLKQRNMVRLEKFFRG